MPKFQVVKSVFVKAKAEDVYKVVSDFHHWQAWSPWLIQEPEAKVTVEPDGKSYEWEGKRVGKGSMQVTNEAENKSIDYDLTFLTPYKSQAKVRFELKEQDGGVEVFWHMDSSLPFFMFWMKKMMIAFIGMDYQRGLNMLKELIETGKVNSKLEFQGESNYEGCSYIGIKHDVAMSDMATNMQSDFGELEQFSKEHADLIAGKPFAIYHKWDMVNGKVSFTSGLPVKETPSGLKGTFTTGSIPATRVYKLTHKGAYQHLGNAWSSLMGMERAKVFKKNKGIHPFEVYDNDPREVTPEEQSTTIHFAVK